MSDDLDLVHSSSLEVVEHTLVLTLGISRQRVAVSLEVEHEVTRQHRLCGKRVAENLLNLRSIDRHWLGGAPPHLSGRIGTIQSTDFLLSSIVTAPELPSGLGRTTKSDSRLEQDASRNRTSTFRTMRGIDQWLSLTSITNLVPRTPRIAVGVLTFIAPGELRAISPDIIESVPLFIRVSIEPLKLLELNL